MVTINKHIAACFCVTSLVSVQLETVPSIEQTVTLLKTERLTGRKTRLMHHLAACVYIRNSYNKTCAHKAGLQNL